MKYKKRMVSPCCFEKRLSLTIHNTVDQNNNVIPCFERLLSIRPFVSIPSLMLSVGATALREDEGLLPSRKSLKRLLNAVVSSGEKLLNQRDRHLGDSPLPVTGATPVSVHPYYPPLAPAR